MFIFSNQGMDFWLVVPFWLFRRETWMGAVNGERRRARDIVRAIGARGTRMETSLSHGLLQGREESWLLNYSNVIRTDAFFLIRSFLVFLKVILESWFQKMLLSFCPDALRKYFKWNAFLWSPLPFAASLLLIPCVTCFFKDQRNIVILVFFFFKFPKVTSNIQNMTPGFHTFKDLWGDSHFESYSSTWRMVILTSSIWMLRHLRTEIVWLSWQLGKLH